jgi:hypothetical protein
MINLSNSREYISYQLINRDPAIEYNMKKQVQYKYGELLESQIEKSMPLKFVPSPRMNKFMPLHELHGVILRHMESVSPHKPKSHKFENADDSPTAGKPVKKNVYNPINGDYMRSLNTSSIEIGSGSRHKQLEKAGSCIIKSNPSNIITN